MIRAIYKADFLLFQYFFAVTLFFSTIINAFFIIRELLFFQNCPSLSNEALGFLCRFSPIGNEWYILYFCLGGIISHYKNEIHKHRILLSIIGFLSWPSAFCVGYYISKSRNELFDPSFNYNTIFIIFFVVGLFAITDNYRTKNTILHTFISHLGQQTFGMYCVHFIFICYIRSHFSIDTMKNRITAYVFVVLLSLLFSEVTSRIPVIRKLTRL